MKIPENSVFRRAGAEIRVGQRVVNVAGVDQCPARFWKVAAFNAWAVGLRAWITAGVTPRLILISF
jgi:hypothetical protein